LNRCEKKGYAASSSNHPIEEPIVEATNRIHCFIAIIGFCMSILTTPARGAVIVLKFDSLPSAQGWSYDDPYGNNTTPESQIFSVNGVTLTQNTINAQPDPASGAAINAYYLKNAPINGSLPFTELVRARVVQDQGNGQPFGFGFNIFTDKEIYGIGISTTKIYDVSGNILSTTIDNTIFHEYRLEANPGVGYNFYVDNILLASKQARAFDPAYSPNVLGLGDLTAGMNASAYVTEFKFSQLSPPIPEPSTLPMGLVGIGIVLFTRRVIGRALFIGE
jgi:hypothetical protein